MITRTTIKALRIGSRDGDAGGVGDHSGRSEDPAGPEESDDALGVLGRGNRQSGGRSGKSEEGKPVSRLWRAVIKVGAGSQAMLDKRQMRSSSVEKSGLETELRTRQHFEWFEKRQAAQARAGRGTNGASEAAGTPGEARDQMCPMVPRGPLREDREVTT